MNEFVAKIPAFGLTGGIASGKSSVARRLEELGANVIDADAVGHELLQPGKPAYSRVISVFGPEILASTSGPAREIDRKRLAAIVFADPAKLRTLNEILHPLILLRILESTADAQKRQSRAVTVVEAPLIYEAGIDKDFLKIIVTWCTPEQQFDRLIARGTMSRAEAKARIEAQIAPEEKRRRANYVIDCSTTIEDTRAQVQAIYPGLQRVIATLPAE
jgi:dephospho-CoA kinase